jgi:hypothetical protein
MVGRVVLMAKHRKIIPPKLFAKRMQELRVSVRPNQLKALLDRNRTHVLSGIHGRPIRKGGPKFGPLQFADAIPPELAGKWLVWSSDRLKIVGSGETFKEALAIADASPGRVIAWAPRPEQLRPVEKAAKASAT